MIEYKFADPPNTAYIICKHILDDGEKVLFVSHYRDDRSWQFLSGAENHQEDDTKIVGIGEIINVYPDLNDLFEMPLSVYGERQDPSSH